jgi:hypothetical protein
MEVEGRAIDTQEVVNSVRPEVVSLYNVLALTRFVCEAGDMPETWFHHYADLLLVQHVQSDPR